MTPRSSSPLPLPLLLAAGLVGTSCGDDGPAATATESATTATESSSGAGETTTAGAADVTWYQHVQPIIAEHCWACHSAEGALSFSLESYETAKSFSALMLEKIEGSDGAPYFMPPFLARETESCTPTAPWRDDPRLSDEEIAIVRDWTEAGAPEGDPTDAAELPPWMPETLEGEIVTTLESEGFTIGADVKDDQYRCFSLDPKLDKTSWITGLQVKPGDPAVVHHVVLFSDPDGASAAKAGDDGSYPCFGGADVPNSSVLYAWAPGGNPLELPDGAGIPVEPGQNVVMQVHYHPSGAATTDATALSVRWSETQPQRQAIMAIIGGVSPGQANSPSWADPPFKVPAGAADHVETWEETIALPPGDVRIWSIFPHMHLVGTSIEVTIEHAGAVSCLAPLPRWDFDWQRTYIYDAPFAELPRVHDGDIIRIRCTYDNSTGNAALVKALAAEGIAEPQDMTVGEDTLDEMCVGIIGVMY